MQVRTLVNFHGSDILNGCCRSRPIIEAILGSVLRFTEFHLRGLGRAALFFDRRGLGGMYMHYPRVVWSRDEDSCLTTTPDINIGIV